MRRAIADTALMAVSAMGVIVALIMFDERVREHVRAAFDARHPGAALSVLGQRLDEVAVIVVTAARQQSLEHAPLVIFAVVAAVLVICMLRT